MSDDASHDHILTRALLASGAVDAIVAQAAPGLRLLTEAERQKSLTETLALRPAGKPVWLFAYGSLIWNPTIRAVERRTAWVTGWHREFCLSTQVGRGTLENPGLLLGLDRGGSCTGAALRLAEPTINEELTLLWRREMLAGAYVPRWVSVSDPQGSCFASAIAFTIDPRADRYAGGLTRDVIVRRLATAAGTLGTAADYLFRTRDGLRRMGIPDPELERLAASVEAFRTTIGGAD